MLLGLLSATIPDRPIYQRRTCKKRLSGQRSLSIQCDALKAALRIMDERIAVCRKSEIDWAARSPDDQLGAATERAARREPELVADQLRALRLTSEGRCAAYGDPLYPGRAVSYVARASNGKFVISTKP